jgi:hypothetical protein
MDLTELQEQLLGWELPSALDACAEQNITTHVTVTAPPQRAPISDAIDQADLDDLTYRVVAVRAGASGSLLLVVSAENW